MEGDCGFEDASDFEDESYVTPRGGLLLVSRSSLSFSRASSHYYRPI
jgi:hypothetical protein